MGWVSIHNTPVTASSRPLWYWEPEKVVIPANAHATIAIPGVYTTLAQYRHDASHPAALAVERDPHTFDDYQQVLFLRPPFALQGRRIRVRAFGISSDWDGEVEVRFAIASERFGEATDTHIVMPDGELTTTALADGGDMPWYEFGAIADGTQWNGLAATSDVPSWGARIEWQVWEEETPPADRKVMVRASKDGGHNWGPWRESSLGALGQYQHRVRFRRFGRGNNFCFQIRVTSPINMDHMGAVADIEVGE